jgi:hypothetical protein
MGVSAASFATTNTNTDTEVRGDRNVDLSIETFKDLKFKLSVKNLSNRSYIAIKSSTGEALYSECTPASEENYSKVFDLSNPLDGKYAFVVETNGSVYKGLIIQRRSRHMFLF